MTIKAEEKPLGKIFSDDYLFQIPDYQRPYAWTTEQTSELLEDLMTTMRENPDQTYFLGSIVLIKGPNDPPSQVVDGQQRLTTLTILFCVLRELTTVQDHSDELDTYVRARGRRLAGIPDQYRLSLRKRDRDIFKENVQLMGKLAPFVNGHSQLTDSQNNFRENARHLWSKLSDTNQTHLDDLASFIIRQCYLVVVSAPDQESAYRIFTVMNDRGLNLSPTDILKADVIGGIDPERRSEYTDTWEEIEENLGRDNFRDLFAHIRMIHVKSKARGNLTREFRDGVLKDVDGIQFLDTTLIPLADAYHAVSRAAYESRANPDTVNRYLTYLGRIDNFDWVPPAILYFSLYPNDEDRLIQFLVDLDRLAYAMLILRCNINFRIARYSSLLHEIEADSDLQSRSSALQLSDEEKIQTIVALNGSVYLQRRVCLPLLLRLDSILAEEGASYEHKVLSVEHVLPQSPPEPSIWLQTFSDPDEREQFTHKLANLVLLSRRKNSKAKNFDFDRKKTEYFQRSGVTTFAITSQVLATQDWTPAVLKQRQDALLSTLGHEWRL